MVNVAASTPITWKKELIPLSVSVGLGQYDAETNPEDITSRSDQALYSAKKAGKNTFKVFEPANNT
jgi:GGDEF domain-containing protein